LQRQLNFERRCLNKDYWNIIICGRLVVGDGKNCLKKKSNLEIGYFFI